MKITERLFEFEDAKYAKFQSKLTPNISPESIIGVRVPVARKLAKEYKKEDESKLFIRELPHRYYDENIVHALLISEINDYNTCIEELYKFLPYVDNWAVCDILSPKVFKKNRNRLITDIKNWVSGKHEYTVRFGIEMLMQHFLDEDFKHEYHKIPASIKSEEYYVNMMIAWYFATALAKRWDTSIKYIEENKLNRWTHNKTIQKALESYRISDEKKVILRGLRR